ncbi:MAG: hypothetical protein HN341_14500 [Verrucomicrobia bacterium]|nr:hypothetical protein [Verrucomicrobiota bacterium]
MKTLLLALLIACCAMCGCEDDDSTSGNAEPTSATNDTVNVSPLPTLPDEVLVQWGEFTITAHLTLAGQPTQELSQGQTPDLHLRVAYSGSSQTNVTYNDGAIYDFIVLDEQGTTIWQWSDGLGFPAAVWDMTINTNDVLEYSEPWTVSVGRGLYELRAIWSVWPEPPPAQIWLHVDP